MEAKIETRRAKLPPVREEALDPPPLTEGLIPYLYFSTLPFPWRSLLTATASQRTQTNLPLTATPHRVLSIELL